ncbi:acyl-CoA dehydrogenase family protein [Microbacterium sp. zg.B48]|uniref:acyl-CoA dehydrogenase family protein n=1 Tax=unclassified Microbacterium TaxID=2609290 RepID=UPI00214CB4ED|nr:MULTISPECIES: acyl-CoA dehydrogenase family protein [unclassified Microbacterium]MCR2763026.1 acyl-CoA dehydrogenase family protein [Microbacterium sp. zg.B48]MCR2808659.1 acyl-CoA dehydrogenase family protein [Microbacterium sp. zg.B185]WIM18908.1 acyl-CoA dehydrogenase family protein [Microbacterium sp. zg-B185]
MTMTMPTSHADERAAIVAAVRDFAQAEIAPHALDWDERKHFPRDVLARAGELGLGGIYVREDVGGSALSRADAVAVVEELAKADPSIAAYITIHNMVAWMIDSYGTDAQRRRWLPGLTAMTDFGSYCLTEPGAGSDAAAITTSAIRITDADGGDSYALTGVKQFISGGGEASVYVVMARTGEPGARGITAFLVPADAPGLSFGVNEKKMGWNAQPTRQVILDEVRVAASDVLGAEGQGFKIAMSGLNGGRISIAACSLGGAQWALDRAVQYVHERFTFGEPLAEKQSVVFTLADMATELRAARALVRDAATAIDEQAPDAAMQCAMAKRFATDAGSRIANEALQLHGGYGYLHEYGFEKVVRDLRVHQILEGTNEIMRVIIGRELLGPSR